MSDILKINSTNVTVQFRRIRRAVIGEWQTSVSEACQAYAQLEAYEMIIYYL